MKRVVITGVGIVSPLGARFDEFAAAVLAGRSAIAPIRAFDAATFASPVAAEAALDEAQVAEAAAATGCDRLALRIDRKLVFGRRAASAAVAHAFDGAPPADLALSLGMGLEVLLLPDVAALYDPAARDLDAARLPAFRAAGRANPLRLSLDHVVRAVADAAGARGRIRTIVSACASGTQAVGEGAAWIARGAARAVVAGATDSMVNPMGVGCFSLLGALSPRACRPFHRGRDGTVIGEGAAFFVLEPLDAARARGARPLAEVLGFATSLDAWRVTAPHPGGDGARRAMAAAWARAGRPRLGYVNAHGTGTPLNDRTELEAVRATVGEAPIGASKSQLGHAMAAAGALELAATLLCFTHGQCAPTAHLDDVDPACAADHVTAARRFAGDAALSNSFGFGGQNASILVGGPP